MVFQRLLLIVCFVSLSGCGNPTASLPKPLLKAVVVAKQLTSSKHIRKSSFLAIKDKKPSTYVSYLFSTMGSAEWPPSEELASAMEREQMRAIRVALLPKGVHFYPNKVNMDGGMQLVISADDKDWKIIVKGYTDPHQGPVIEKSWSFPQFLKK